MARLRSSRSANSRIKFSSTKKSGSKSKSRKRRNISKSSSMRKIGFEKFENKSPNPDSLKAEYLFNKYDRLMKDKPRRKKKGSLSRREQDTRKSNDWKRVSQP